MNFSRFFIDRPIFAGVLSVLLFLGGAISVACCRSREYPEVVPPSVVVRASYPGASPKVVAETVATPLEEQINGVENMLYMSSQATSDGAMTLTVTFRSAPIRISRSSWCRTASTRLSRVCPKRCAASGSPR